MIKPIRHLRALLRLRQSLADVQAEIATDWYRDTGLLLVNRAIDKRWLVFSGRNPPAWRMVHSYRGKT